MDLPIRIDSSGPQTRILSVDGAWGAEGLNLSHWPGNTTPADLVHELSTGSALRFARLSDTERAERAGEAESIVNNHYDTDGVLALFATRHPQQALEFDSQILNAAAAGDFYRSPNARAFSLDALITRFVNPEHSEAARPYAEDSDDQRYTAITRQLLEELPTILGSETLPYPELWQADLERNHSDLNELAEAKAVESEALDLCTFIGRWPWKSTGPGRHALFGSTERDRVLSFAPDKSGGHIARLVISTRSWFDHGSRPRLPRPDLEQLAEELNQLEPNADLEAAAWRAQKSTNASPELWFGTSELESFAEYSDALRPSELTLRVISERVEACLSLTVGR